MELHLAIHGEWRRFTYHFYAYARAQGKGFCSWPGQVYAKHVIAGELVLEYHAWDMHWERYREHYQRFQAEGGEAEDISYAYGSLSFRAGEAGGWRPFEKYISMFAFVGMQTPSAVPVWPSMQCLSRRHVRVLSGEPKARVWKRYQ